MLQQLENGLVQGALYAIVALGYTMVYGILLMINFAHADVLMVGAYAGVLALAGLAASGAIEAAGAPVCLALACGAAMFVAGAHGVLLERLAYRPLRKAHALAPLISAIGMSIVLQNYVMLAQGSTPKYVPSGRPAWQDSMSGVAFSAGGVNVARKDILILAVCLAVMFGLHFFVQHTRFGTAMRATSQDRVMAGLVGIDVDRVIAVTFGLGSAMAGIAGVLVSVYFEKSKFDMGFLLGIKAFTAAVLGGIGNLRGAMLGGLVLGLAEYAGIHLFKAEYQHVYTFVILLVVLMVRPRGILGERVAEKV